jgi:hypothetical protein
MVGGCNLRSESDAVGRYSAAHEDAIEELVLSADGGFVQRVRATKSGRTCESKGRWEFQVTESYIRLDNYLSSWDEPSDAACPQPGVALLPIRRFVSVFIEISDHFSYTRQ